MDYKGRNDKIGVQQPRSNNQDFNRSVSGTHLTDGDIAFQEPEFVQHYPAHLRGPGQNRHGGHQMFKLRGFKGAEYKDYGPGRVLDGDEKQRIIKELRARGEID